MTTTTTTTDQDQPRNQVMADRTDEQDLILALLGIRGVLNALNLIIVEKVADDVLNSSCREELVCNLIVAGEQLTEVTKRF